MFKKVGWNRHLLGNQIIDMTIICSIVQIVTGEGIIGQQLTLEINLKGVSVLSFAFQASVICVEFHSFQFDSHLIDI